MVVVDDHVFLLESLVRLFGDDVGIMVVGTPGTARATSNVQCRSGLTSCSWITRCRTWTAGARKTRAVHEVLDAMHRVARGERISNDEDEEPPSLQELVVFIRQLAINMGATTIGGNRAS